MRKKTLENYQSLAKFRSFRDGIMSNIIKLANSDKFFLADFTNLQPIEPIIKQCYKQFGLEIPGDLSNAKLSVTLDDKEPTLLKYDDYNKRLEFYQIPNDAELVFEP